MKKALWAALAVLFALLPYVAFAGSYWEGRS